MMKRRIMLLAAMLVSLLAAVLAAEMIARHSLPPRHEVGPEWGRLWIGHDDPEVLMDTMLNPNVSITYTGMWAPLNPTTITINSYGFRDREYAPEKQVGVRRIIVLGGSQTFGQGVELQETYPKRLEAMLNGRGGNLWEVLNFGVPGWYAKQKCFFFNETGLPFSPDIVIFHINDGDNTDDSRILKNHPRLVRLMVSLQQTDSGLAWYAARAIERHLYIDLRHEISPPDWSNLIPAIEELATLGEEHGFRLVVAYERRNPVYEAVQMLEGRQDMLFLDLDAGKEALGYGPSEEFCLHPMDCHPSPEGHQVIAQILFSHLEQEALI